MSEGTFFARFRYAIPITLTAASLQLYDVPQMHYIPSKDCRIPNSRLANYSWEDSYIPAKADVIYTTEIGVEAIRRFATTLIDGMVDIPPEFSRVIDENFWDLF